ncbi:MAG: aminotransferase [Oscillospiraceae bacterium]|nr:aminotransferase [Oscillospiraceae bacterium]
MPASIKIPFERCREGAVVPHYVRDGDAGMDICAAEDADILPGQTVLVPTGLKFAIPRGYEMQIRPRSGISLRTALRIPNAPGTIDSGFRDEVGVILTNMCLPVGSNTIESIMEIVDNADQYPRVGLDGAGSSAPSSAGPCIYEIKKGDRIAQIVIKAVPAAELFEVDDVGEYGGDRRGGFGSTGVNDG